MSAPSASAGATEFQHALTAFSQRRIPAALRLFHRAEGLGYEPDCCAGYRWLCWMLAGRFQKAWQESEGIAKLGKPDPLQLWDGRPFTRKRVLIRCLHGYGDTIQFVRYATLVRLQADAVLVQTHPELVSLLRGMPAVDEVISWHAGTGPEPYEFDQQIEVMELPRAFHTTLATVPNRVPYLTVSPQRRIPSRVPSGNRRHPRIGLQWGSSDWNPARSVRLEELRPLLEMEQFAFFSFQRGTARSQLADMALNRPIHDVSGDSPEIVEAAADLLEIDLLISVDTMLAHLAGALAKPVWLLLPFEADWRWMLHREDSPWYPTMRLFRQPRPGDWRTPIQQMLQRLRRLATHTGSFRLSA